MTAIKKEVIIGDCRLLLGDCLEVISTLGRFDVTITDPPYGVGGGVGSGLRKNRKSKTKYKSFEDTPEYIIKTVLPAIRMAIENSSRMAVTPGFKNLFSYPEPDHIGSFQYPGSSVMSCWGPCLWQPVLYYGKDPHQGKLRPDSFRDCNDVDRTTQHPCPKPLKQWTRLVKRASRTGESVLDPFMGSGTTGVACVKLGRKFTGIELDETYFDIACQRIQEAYDQPDFFTTRPKQEEQEQLNMLDSEQ